MHCDFCLALSFRCLFFRSELGDRFLLSNYLKTFLLSQGSGFLLLLLGLLLLGFFVSLAGKVCRNLGLQLFFLLLCELLGLEFLRCKTLVLCNLRLALCFSFLGSSCSCRFSAFLFLESRESFLFSLASSFCLSFSFRFLFGNSLLFSKLLRFSLSFCRCCSS